MDVELKEIWERIKDKKNVVGHSGSLMPKIKDGEIVKKTRVFRVYVSKKEPLDELDEEDVIPDKICDVEIDVYEVGEIKAQEKKRCGA
ncbi:MAG: hypothetical protein ACLFVP_03120 [Candidatus Bathyarchaeia archaeon]